LWKEITSKITSNEISELASELIKIRSDEEVGEKEICYFLFDYLKALGFSVEIQNVSHNRPNIIARINGNNNGESLMFNGHLDTVPIGNIENWKFEPFEPVIKNNKLFGRGATDMKGSIASAIIAIKRFIEKNEKFNGEIIFVGVMGEETEGLGSEKIIKEGIRANMAIVGEPSDGNIYRAHKGTLWFNLKTYGVAEHSSQIKTTSNNAIQNMSFFIEEIGKMNSELEKINSVVGHPTINIGKITGGIKQNIIPDKCVISVDRRLLPKEDPHLVINNITKRLQRLEKKDNRLKFEINIKMIREGTEINESERIVSLVSNAIKLVLKTSPNISGMKATTDMSILVNKGNIPTVIYGPGYIKQAHIDNEFIELSQLVNASKVYATIFSELLLKK